MIEYVKQYYAEEVERTPEQDLNMPRMGGREMLKRMREDAGIPEIPFIFFSADARSEAECLRLGAVDFLLKPYPDPEVIRLRVKKCIELAGKR